MVGDSSGREHCNCDRMPDFNLDPSSDMLKNAARIE